MVDEKAARIRAIRAAALDRGDHNLVAECDQALRIYAAWGEIETTEPAPVEVAILPRRRGRPRKNQWTDGGTG